MDGDGFGLVSRIAQELSVNMFSRDVEQGSGVVIDYEGDCVHLAGICAGVMSVQDAAWVGGFAHLVIDVGLLLAFPGCNRISSPQDTGLGEGKGRRRGTKGTFGGSSSRGIGVSLRVHRLCCSKVGRLATVFQRLGKVSSVDRIAGALSRSSASKRALVGDVNRRFSMSEGGSCNCS